MPQLVICINPPCLKELPDIGIIAITQMFNNVLRTGYVPSQWKVSQIIAIPKPGTPAEAVTSHGHVRLIPILSKLYGKLFLTRLKPVLQETRFIPGCQFGFRQKHFTNEQVQPVPVAARSKA